MKILFDMNKKVIKINEAKIREMVSKALNEALNEFTDIMKFPPGFVAKKGREWQIDRIKKEAEKHPDLDPNGFMWVGDTLRHNDKKKPKAAPQPKIPKPQGMSDIEYVTLFAPKYNKRLANGIKKMREISSGEEEKWETLDVTNLRSGDVAQSFADRYYISNFGAVALSNESSVSDCHISIPYFDRSTKRYQINLRIYDNGEEVDHLCPSVVGLVRKVFGDEWAEKLIEKERAEIRNGTAVVAGDETDF